MKIKTLLIEIHLDKSNIKSDLDLRHLLVDTIEGRNLGEVIEETSSPEVLEVVLEVSGNKIIEDELKGLLTSLGFNQYKIQDISNEDA
ncbi:hypothetical protein [Albibacterium sp.]|uniref:hypothetical protein n=1 Tax=Albibacterium sp. TaxID=2952885 RepID=UPI002C05262E|nr:hypothetical protein [Albibacterium sp.]HUH17864.1 hypothetical protein [Albibacterium sp.]